MPYEEDLHVRFSKKQMTMLTKLAEHGDMTKAEVIRRAIEIMGSKDKVLIPLNYHERKFIEDVAQNLGVDSTQAVRMILLSFNVLTSCGLLKVIKPIDELLEELKSTEEEEDGREATG